MEVHLIDGTYELFRHYFAVPKRQGPSGAEVAAAGGVLESMLILLEGGATHVGVATDREIRSFRNDLYDDYKAGEDVEPELLAQFPILETVLEAAGFTIFPMVEYEADDAMATAATIAEADPRVDKVWICTPDKDLAQCVSDPRVVQLDRRQELEYDEAAVFEKFGVRPESIPDYLGLRGDTADGFPGLQGWGAKSAATVLARYVHLEAIPDDVEDWDVQVRGAARLAETLANERELAMLFRTIATVVRDVPEFGTVDDWEWRGPPNDEELEKVCIALGRPQVADRVRRIAASRA
ncbi:MAG: flap endonuclease [Chloroflexi bacterium]|nr:flap endonuclease [Chloroflexota bacterium]MDA1147142.1 flap endonuclease [Chloroflexota bacterium]